MVMMRAVDFYSSQKEEGLSKADQIVVSVDVDKSTVIVWGPCGSCSGRVERIGSGRCDQISSRMMPAEHALIGNS